YVGLLTLRSARYSDLSDGNRGDWEFGLPFHETAASHSLESYGQIADERVLRFRDDALVDSSRHHLFQFGLMGGVALHANTHTYTRLWGAWEWRREDFAPSEVSPFRDSVCTAVRAGIELGRDRFGVREQLNS